MKLLTISGSLRNASSNTRLLEALALVASPVWQVVRYHGLGELPHFSPDLDVDPCPPPVAQLREQLRWADAVAICSPEYAHGVPGSLKNALDWIVSSGDFVEKRVALINASQVALHAYASLAETLKMMMAVIVPEASPVIALQGSKLSAAEIANHPEFGPALRQVLAELVPSEANTFSSRL